MSENRCTETWCSTCITLLDKCFIPYSNVFCQAPVLVLVYHPHYQIATRLQNLKKESNGYNVKSILSFNLLIINLFRAHLQKEKKKYLIKKSVKMFYLNQVLSGKHQVRIRHVQVSSECFLLGGMQCISIRYWARFFVLQCWALCIGVGTVT